MGSATTQAQQVVLAVVPSSADLGVAEDLFAASRVIAHTPGLVSALADSSAPGDARVRACRAVFQPSVSAPALALLEAIAAERWSHPEDLIGAVEDVAIRVASLARAEVDLEGELFEFGRVIAANAELELALGSRLGSAEIKGELVQSLLHGRASDAVALIASALVQNPRERRVRQLLRHAMTVVADQRDRAVATVMTARELTPVQAERLTALLAQRYGRAISLNTIVDESVVGGMRVQIADDVIDASVSTRLAELRQRLAG